MVYFVRSAHLLKETTMTLTAQAAAASTLSFDIQGHPPTITQTNVPAAAELTAANREVAYHLDLAARLRAVADDSTTFMTVTVDKALLREAAKHLEEGGAALNVPNAPAAVAASVIAHDAAVAADSAHDADDGVTYDRKFSDTLTESDEQAALLASRTDVSPDLVAEAEFVSKVLAGGDGPVEDSDD